MNTFFCTLTRVLTVLFTAILLNSCASSLHTVDMGATPFYDLEKNEIALEKLERFLEGKWDGEPFALKIPNGFDLPVHIAVDTPVAQLDSDAGSLHFKRDFYIYLAKKKSLASPDGIRWASFSDMELMKKLFDGDQGSLAVSMSGTKNEGMLLSLSLLLTPKQ